MLNLDGEDLVEEVQVEEKSDKFNPFAFVEAISYTKDDELIIGNEKNYNPFLINKALSFYPDTVIQANEMNKRHFLDKDIQFKFLLDFVRRKKRYGGWMKKTKESEKIEVIKTFYKYSTAKAMSVAHLISEADLTVMHQKMSTGGLNARPHSEEPTGVVSSSGSTTKKSRGLSKGKRNTDENRSGV